MSFKTEEKIYRGPINRSVLSLLPGTGKKILDIGCGTGVLAEVLKSRGHLVDGISISEKELEIAANHLQCAFLYNLENGLPPDIVNNTYDYVVCSHVLEHIVYPNKLLLGIRNVLKESGSLVVALPNIMHYSARLKILAGNFEYDKAGMWDNTHVKWYTFGSGQRLLADNGFKVEYADVWGDLPFNSIASKILPEKIRVGLFNQIKRLSRGFFGYELLYRASKQ